MENSFVDPQKSNYQSEAHRKDSSRKLIPKKIGEKNRIGDRELNHKSIWRSINIFSKIKKIKKAKTNGANANVEETNSRIVNSDYQNKKTCKNNEMDDKSNLEKNNASGSAGEETTSIGSKGSFFDKINLESLLKIFVDLHKKKQSQDSKSNKHKIDDGTVVETNCAGEEQFLENQNTQLDSAVIIEQCRSSAHVISNEKTGFPAVPSKGLLNPVNSPSFLKGGCDKDSSNVSEDMNSTSQTDSTLSLLKCVRLKLKNYLNAETTDNDGDVKQLDNAISPEIKMANQVDVNPVIVEDEDTLAVTAINIVDSDENSKQNADFNEDCLISDHCSYSLNGMNDSKIDIKFEDLGEKSRYLSKYDETSFPSSESNDKKLAYAIVECDIKCMIKELLKESKDLKNSIVATGIEEEPIPQFTQISKYFESVPLCKSLFNDLINTATNKQMHSLKHKKQLNVTFKQDIEEDVAVILGNLVENVLYAKPLPPSQDVFINFCLVQNNPIDKTKKLNNDPKTAKFCESNVYYLTKKFRKMQSSTRRIFYPPRVTVKNLSTNKYIKFMAVENSLISRIRRSAALLMALYDEMRDYTYYSCTSNILCELYESMMRQGLISVANNTPKKSIETGPVAVNTTVDEKNEISRQRDSETSKSLSINVKLFTPSNVPCSSSNNNPSDSIDARATSSNDCVSSESDVEEIKPKLLLPNLKYTYQSDEEINTPEEVKTIDDNVSRNGGCEECIEMHVTELDRKSDEAMSLDPMNVSINEDEAFLKK